ncbi:ATP-binding cassette domain-containing protein [Paenibacillus sp. P26]|nr:ATP-binding cassette domain-containing protein [Paenibacillus sp. P26]UUZ94704.1 ATP-binding cassette domain-containing protein [Paenibacillus sp. P25]
MTLQVEQLGKLYDGKRALYGLSFCAEKGKAFGLLGGNGAGKTTTIRIILGLMAADEGRVAWEGRELRPHSPTIGYLPEERGLYPKIKAGEQLHYLARLEGMEKAAARKAVSFWLERLGVPEHADKPLEQLSKGNQQKIQLVAALLHDPELVILDEPFSGLDPVNAELLADVVRELLGQGKTIVFSSHQMRHVEQFCDQICILSRGQTLLAGNLREIKRSYGRTQVMVQTDADISELLKKRGCEIRTPAVGEYSIQTESEADAHALLQELVGSRVPLYKFELAEPTLHEIFIDKVGRGA